MQLLSRVLLSLPVSVVLVGCAIDPPSTPASPTSLEAPQLQTDTMAISYDLETTEPLVWVATVEVEAVGTRLIVPEKFALKTDENQYFPYLYDDPATLQPGDTRSFSVTYKVDDYLEKPTSILIY